MDGSLVKLIAVLIAVMVPAYFVLHWLWQAFWYSAPRPFEHGGETYIWVPDPAPRGFFAKRYEHGSFEYADGTPVTDPYLVREIEQGWIGQQRRWERSNHE